jgi:hypothetical protein
MSELQITLEPLERKHSCRPGKLVWRLQHESVLQHLQKAQEHHPRACLQPSQGAVLPSNQASLQSLQHAAAASPTPLVQCLPNSGQQNTYHHNPASIASSRPDP